MSVEIGKIREMLGGEADTLLNHVSKTIPKENIHLPGGDLVDRVWSSSDRNPRVLRSLQTLHDHGRLGGTGYVSILPVDQGIEHSAGASFAEFANAARSRQIGRHRIRFDIAGRSGDRTFGGC